METTSSLELLVEQTNNLLVQTNQGLAYIYVFLLFAFALLVVVLIFVLLYNALKKFL